MEGSGGEVVGVEVRFIFSSVGEEEVVESWSLSDSELDRNAGVVGILR